jgi:hypothetical protein
MDLIAEIKKEVKRLDSNLIEGAEDFNAACLVLLLANAEADEENWDCLEQGCSAALSVPFEQIGQMIANLRCGGTLEISGFHDSLSAALAGEESGTVFNLLVNAALGRMEYLPSSQTWRLTPVGKSYVENKLLRI